MKKNQANRREIQRRLSQRRKKLPFAQVCRQYLHDVCKGNRLIVVPCECPCHAAQEDAA